MPTAPAYRPSGAGAIPLGIVALALLLASSAWGEVVPGPSLDASAPQDGAFCEARGDAFGSGTGFAAALAAIAIVRRRRSGRS